MAAQAKPDVIGLATVVAVRGNSCRHSSAAKTKLHKLVSKSESFWSPVGLSHTADQKPSRLICSRVENQKIFWVCLRTVLRIDSARRSEEVITKHLNCSCWNIFLNVPETASSKYRLVFLVQTLSVSVPQSTSINAARTPSGVSISKYPSGTSGIDFVSGTANDWKRSTLNSDRCCASE
jgi:hypothetical protein